MSAPQVRVSPKGDAIAVHAPHDAPGRPGGLRRWWAVVGAGGIVTRATDEQVKGWAEVDTAVTK